MSRDTQRRYAALDGLRGIAALTVFAIHVWIYQLPNTVELRRDSSEKTLLFEGRVAFVMFFVLSGYLLYRAFARAALRSGEPVNVRSYLVRRAARIVPAYYVAILGTLALLAAAGDVPGRRLVDAAQLPLFFVFAQNYSPDTLLKLNAATWTLAVEVAFYVMLPVIGWLALRCGRGSAGRQALLLGGLAAAGLAWNVVDYAAGWGPVASHSAPSFLPYFACGMLVALMVESRRARGAAPSARRERRAGGGRGRGAGANGWWHATDAHDSFAMEVLADSGAALAFAAIIAALVLGTGTGVRWMGVRPLAWMGEITYGFYLWHIPLIVCARGLGILPAGVVLGLRRAARGDRLRRCELVLARAADHAPRRAAAARGSRGRRVARPAEPAARYRSQVRTIAFANPRP